MNTGLGEAPGDPRAADSSLHLLTGGAALDCELFTLLLEDALDDAAASLEIRLHRQRPMARKIDGGRW